jgi:tetratricopeptide (TPR) repeat protein
VLRQALGENAPEVAKLMPELRQRYSDIPEPVSLPPEQERRYLLHGVGEFVERAARGQPLLLIFEDLHRADESTLLLLRHLAQRISEVPVLILGTYRHLELEPGRPLTAVLPDLLRQRRVEEFLLRRLDEDGVAAILEGRAGKRPPPELVSLVYSETEGNPFFVEEVFRHLHDAGKLFDDEGNFRSGIHIADTEVPRGVSLVIGHRLDRVGETCRRALTAAAVVGRTFRFDLLGSIANVEEEELLDAIEEAEHAILVEDASEGREARYAFVHEQIRQTLLSTLSTPRRQRLHVRVADALEKLYGSAVEDRAVDVAHHLYSAGAAADGERTARYLTLAGQRAIAALAFEDALRHFEAVRTILSPDDRESQARVLRLRAQALRGAARMDEALETFAEALESAPEGTERESIQYERASLQLDLFRAREAIEDLESLLVRARDAGDEKRELDVLLALGRAHYILSLDNPGYAQSARDSYQRAYDRAKELGDRRAMARALIPTGWFTDYWPDYREQAIANAKEAAALAEELGDEELALDGAMVGMRQLAPDEQVEVGESIRARLEARRDPLRLKEHYFWLMWQYWFRAELERCVETCDAGIALADQLGTEPVQYPTIKALALMDLGRLDEAWKSLGEEVADEEHRFGRAVQQVGVAVYLESVCAFEQAIETAKADLVEAQALSRTWMQGWLISLLTTLSVRTRDDALRAHVEKAIAETGFQPSPLSQAERHLAEGDPEEALRLANESTGGAERVGLRRIHLTGLELQLRILIRMGRSSEAASLAEEALAKIEETGFRSIAWRVRASRARALDQLGDSDAADRERAAARATLRELAARIPDPEHRARFETEGEV